MKYANYFIKNNRELVKISILNNPRSLLFVDKQFLNDKEIVELAII